MKALHESLKPEKTVLESSHGRITIAHILNCEPSRVSLKLDGTKIEVNK